MFCRVSLNKSPLNLLPKLSKFSSIINLFKCFHFMYYNVMKLYYVIGISYGIILFFFITYMALSIMVFYFWLIFVVNPVNYNVYQVTHPQFIVVRSINLFSLQNFWCLNISLNLGYSFRKYIIFITVSSNIGSVVENRMKKVVHMLHFNFGISYDPG